MPMDTKFLFGLMKCSKVDYGNDYTMNILKTTDLYSLNGLIV